MNKACKKFVTINIIVEENMKPIETIILGLALIGTFLVVREVVEYVFLKYEQIKQYLEQKAEAIKSAEDIFANTFNDKYAEFTYIENFIKGDYSTIAGVMDRESKQIKDARRFKSKEIDATLKEYHANGKKVVIYN